MVEKITLTGNHAAAYAAKSAKAEVVAAYPITPQTPVVEKVSEFVDGKEIPNTRFVCVESEQSAIAAIVGAAQTGARVFTATSANGLMYMFEILCWAAGSRLPMVICIAMRGTGAPWTVWTDHQDAFSVRDVGFMQIFAETNQEIYDSVLMAYRISEDPRVYLPCFVSYDGYVISHTMMPVQIEDQAKVDAFLPPLRTHVNTSAISDPLLSRSMNPITPPEPVIRAEGNTPAYQEYRYSLQKAHEYAFEVVEEVTQKFSTHFGRSYGNGIYKTYMAEDAEVMMFAVASVASECRGVVDTLRKEGTKVGLVSLKLFRPFPVTYLREVFQSTSLIVVFDREVGYGYEGILCYELKAAMYAASNHPIIRGFIVGLGGRDITPEDLIQGVRQAIEEQNIPEASQDPHTNFLGLRLNAIGFRKEG